MKCVLICTKLWSEGSLFGRQTKPFSAFRRFCIRPSSKPTYSHNFYTHPHKNEHYQRPTNQSRPITQTPPSPTHDHQRTCSAFRPVKWAILIAHNATHQRPPHQSRPLPQTTPSPHTTTSLTTIYCRIKTL